MYSKEVRNQAIQEALENEENFKLTQETNDKIKTKITYTEDWEMCDITEINRKVIIINGKYKLTQLVDCERDRQFFEFVMRDYFAALSAEGTLTLKVTLDEINYNELFDSDVLHPYADEFPMCRTINISNNEDLGIMGFFDVINLKYQNNLFKIPKYSFRILKKYQNLGIAIKIAYAICQYVENNSDISMATPYHKLYMAEKFFPRNNFKYIGSQIRENQYISRISDIFYKIYNNAKITYSSSLEAKLMTL